jgi:beta-lactamase class A
VGITRRQCLFLFGAGLSAAPANTLAARWSEIAAETDGSVGAAMLHLSSGEHVSLHGADSFPLASVCKLPIAMHILAMVDEKKFSPGTLIEVLQPDVTLNVSEVGHRWPKQRRFPLDELVSLMVAKSDNTAVETLYRIGGGSAAIMARLRGWHVDGIRIDRTEKQCGLDASGPTPAAKLAAMRRFIADPRDTATPDGAVRLLQRLYGGEALSAASTARLTAILETTSTGPDRIKGLLPAGTVVAHKTGITGSAGKLNAGTHDVGVVTLPKGAGQLALAVFVKCSTRDLPARERVIAKIANAAFETPLLH